MPISLGQIQALALLLGGVDAAAEAVGVDEEVYNLAFNDELHRYPKRERNVIEADLITGFEDYLTEHPEEETLLDRAEDLFGGRQLTNEQERIIFEQVLDGKQDFDSVVSGLSALNDMAMMPTKGGNVGLSENQANAIFDVATGNKTSFREMLNALEQDSWSLTDSESAFWRWFDDNYGDED